MKNKILQGWRALAGALALCCLCSGCQGDVDQTSSSMALLPAPAVSEPDVPPQPEGIRYIESGPFELPVVGATGYTTVESALRQAAEEEADVQASVAPGTPFVVLEEEGDWWRIEADGASGWLPHRLCLVNLPDLVPSIIYNNANTYASLFVSSGKAIEGITGEPLYEGRAYNPRLGREEYIVPVLYSMAKKICAAQQAALGGGNCLQIHEGFRPYDVQLAVMQALDTLAQQDAEVLAGISTAPWAIHWFIATDVSNHQMGYAIDLTLVKVAEQREALAGEYLYPVVTSWREYEMPTPLHELSMASAVFTGPIASWSPTEWQNGNPATGMNEAALLLQKYCTDAGLTPLASEWWHFNDLDAREAIRGSEGRGEFTPTTCISRLPE